MNWDAVKAAIGKSAPLIGSLLGGPAGGAVASIVASALGVEATPSAIEQALQSDPQAAVKLAEIESNERVQLQSLAFEQAKSEMEANTARQLAVNATMREESKSEHWPQWAWRPFWGFISGTAFLVVCIFVCVLGYRAIIEGDSEAIGIMPAFVAAFTTLFSVPGAILGVAAWHRGQQKREQFKNA